MTLFKSLEEKGHAQRSMMRTWAHLANVRTTVMEWGHVSYESAILLLARAMSMGMKWKKHVETFTNHMQCYFLHHLTERLISMMIHHCQHSNISLMPNWAVLAHHLAVQSLHKELSCLLPPWLQVLSNLLCSVTPSGDLGRRSYPKFLRSSPKTGKA